MTQTEWNERFSVAIPRLDQQHRQIFELLGQLRELNPGESDRLASGTLEKLLAYSEYHLRREELILRVRGFPGYALHLAEHDEYRAKIAHLRETAVRTNRGIRIVNFLEGWWRNHILTSDRKYAEYFQDTAAAPARP